MDKRKELYSDICRVLTDFEQVDINDLDGWSDTKTAIEGIYETLVDVQNNWSFIIGDTDGASLYILTTVIEGECILKPFYDLDNAQKQMRLEYNEYVRDVHDEDDCEFGEMSAWIRDGLNHDNYDWAIHMLSVPIYTYDWNQSSRLRIPCRYGTLVAQRTGDAGINDDIVIDIEFPDNTAMQLARVGTWSGEGAAPPELYVYGWDGSSEDPVTQLLVNIDSEFRY